MNIDWKKFLTPVAPGLVRWTDPVAIVFLCATVAIAAARLSATDWVNDLVIVVPLAIIGCLAGALLGMSSFSELITSIFALIYGVFVIHWQMGELITRVNLPWLDRLLLLYTRLGTSITNAAQNQAVSDPMLFLLVMTIMFWAVSTYAGFTLTRRGNPWMAILPAGLALFLIHINDPLWPFRTWYLGLFLIFALLLVARNTFDDLRKRWKRHRARIPTYIGLDLSRAALLAAIPLILLAWTVPALAVSVTSAQDSWNAVYLPIRQRLDHLFVSLRSGVGYVSDYYSDTLPLGQGNILSDVVVLQAETPGILPAGARLYWQARSFDQYTSDGWTSTRTVNQPIASGLFDIEIAGLETRTPVTVIITPTIPMRTLHTLSEPYGISESGTADVSFTPDGGVDIGALQADPFQAAGDSYELRAALTSASVAELRAAGVEYPQWVLERYLQLPDNITQRTRQLALEITENAETPYDKAVAVTNFLRTNITYTEIIAEPPSGQERVDWLLFDYRQGFCNYYATAQVVLLRSLGIPARMAVGYAEGERTALIEEGVVPTLQPGQDPLELENLTSERSLYTVRQRNLHAWPQVYFPGVGWVEFEPTTNQAAILRPSGEALPQADPNLGQTPDDIDEGLLDNQQPQIPEGLLPPLPTEEPVNPWITLLIQLGVGALAVAVLIIAWRANLAGRAFTATPLLLERSFARVGIKPPAFLANWAAYVRLSPLKKAYYQVNRALELLGHPPGTADTPAERVASLINLIPESETLASNLLEAYQTHLYSPQPDVDADARMLGGTLQRLAFVAWLRKLFRRFQPPPRRPSLPEIYAR